MKVMALVLAILATLSFLGWASVTIYQSVVFDIDCGGRIKRAADANTIELASKEMGVVVSYIEKRGLTEGYTSILYNTPNEDVGFWYLNLKASLNELQGVGTDVSRLEKTNILMKLRETLLDTGESVKVTLPLGISRFPHNHAFAIWGLMSFVLIAGFWVWFFVLLDRY